MKAKGVLLNISSSYIHIVLSALLNVIYVRISLNYLGVERYGVWVVLSTLINYLTIVNFGVPTAVTNLMAQADNNHEKADLLLKGFRILFLFAVGCLLVVVSGYLLVVFHTKWMDGLTSEITLSSIFLISFFILRIPFQIATSAYTANKKVFIGKIYELLSVVITFVSLLIAIYFKKDLVFLAILSGILLLLLNIISFCTALKIVDFSNFKKPENTIESKALFKLGGGIICCRDWFFNCLEYR